MHVLLASVLLRMNEGFKCSPDWPCAVRVLRGRDYDCFCQDHQKCQTSCGCWEYYESSDDSQDGRAVDQHMSDAESQDGSQSASRAGPLACAEAGSAQPAPGSSDNPSSANEGVLRQETPYEWALRVSHPAQFWFNGKVSKEEYLEFVNDENCPEIGGLHRAKLRVSAQAASMLIGNVMKGHDRERQLIAESVHHLQCTQQQKDELVRSRKKAADLVCDKSLIMTVDAIGQLYDSLMHGLGDYAYGLACTNHGFCSHRSGSCHRTCGGIELVDEQGVQLSKHPELESRFNLSNPNSAISLVVDGVLSTAHFALREKMSRVLSHVYVVLIGILGEESRVWCEQQKECLEKKFKNHSAIKGPAAAECFHAMLNPDYPRTEPLAEVPLEAARARQAEALQHERARVEGILGPGSSSVRSVGVQVELAAAGVASSSAGPTGSCAGAGAVGRLVPMLGSESAEASESLHAVMVGSLRAVPPEFKPWQSATGVRDVVREVVRRKRWASAIFGFPDPWWLCGDKPYLVPAAGMVGHASQREMVEHQERFLGVYRRGRLVHNGKITIDVKLYYESGGKEGTYI